MRAYNRLSARGILTIDAGKHADGGGLWLVKRTDGGGQWVFRYDKNRRRREMGLGSMRFVSLKQARLQAEKWRGVLAAGEDPMKTRTIEQKRKADSKPTLAQVALACFEARKSSLKRDGAAGGWFSPLRLHVLPKLGELPMDEIGQNDIKKTLSPIWQEKPDVAKKALGRLSLIIRHAAAMGIDVDLQITDKAKALLGAQKKTCPACAGDAMARRAKVLR